MRGGQRPAPSRLPPAPPLGPERLRQEGYRPREPHRRLLGMKPMSSVSLSEWTRRACHHSSSLASITCSTSPKRKLRAWLRKPQSLVLS